MCPLQGREVNGQVIPPERMMWSLEKDKFDDLKFSIKGKLLEKLLRIKCAAQRGKTKQKQNR
jgi:hypothetical protein